MRIALIADTFPPLRTSGAVQLRDLAREFVRQGHQVTVILPAFEISSSWQMEVVDGFEVLRLKSPKAKDVGYVRRTIAEFFMPFAMLRNLRRSPLCTSRWDGIVWYAPTIFLGPIAKALKKRNSCKAYLIVRDIFPEWAVDMGLMSRGVPYYFFKAVARYQYSVADIIGVQSPGNLSYFANYSQRFEQFLEVLPNWLDKQTKERCSIRLCQSVLAGRKVFVYAGNMGVAQGMDILLELAERFSGREDLGFLFVGRGSDVKRLQKIAQSRQLNNVAFYDEIHPDEIADLYEQCSVGLVALDPRHKSHNIPGKFLTYMQCGLPVLANINPGNDLAAIIREERVGQVCETNNVDELKKLAEQLLLQIDNDLSLPLRCCRLFNHHFSVDQAVGRVVASLTTRFE